MDQPVGTGPGPPGARADPGGTKWEADGSEQQSIAELLRSIEHDAVDLAHKQVELAKLEISTALQARAMGAGALAGAAVLLLFIVTFLGLAAAAALNYVVPLWASFLIVAGVFILMAGGAVIFGARKFKKPPLSAEQTRRAFKENVEWAKAQLKR